MVSKSYLPHSPIANTIAVLAHGGACIGWRLELHNTIAAGSSIRHGANLDVNAHKRREETLNVTCGQTEGNAAHVKLQKRKLYRVKSL